MGNQTASSASATSVAEAASSLPVEFGGAGNYSLTTPTTFGGFGNNINRSDDVALLQLNGTLATPKSASEEFWM